nr:hypothetical protein Itr_chr03CG16090 [Ipomoea trifida]
MLWGSHSSPPRAAAGAGEGAGPAADTASDGCSTRTISFWPAWQWPRLPLMKKNKPERLNSKTVSPSSNFTTGFETSQNPLFSSSDKISLVLRSSVLEKVRVGFILGTTIVSTSFISVCNTLFMEGLSVLSGALPQPLLHHPRGIRVQIVGTNCWSRSRDSRNLETPIVDEMLLGASLSGGREAKKHGIIEVTREVYFHLHYRGLRLESGVTQENLNFLMAIVINPSSGERKKENPPPEDHAFTLSIRKVNLVEKEAACLSKKRIGFLYKAEPELEDGARDLLVRLRTPSLMCESPRRVRFVGLKDGKSKKHGSDHLENGDVSHEVVRRPANITVTQFIHILIFLTNSGVLLDWETKYPTSSSSQLVLALDCLSISSLKGEVLLKSMCSRPSDLHICSRMLARSIVVVGRSRASKLIPTPAISSSPSAPGGSMTKPSKTGIESSIPVDSTSSCEE